MLQSPILEQLFIAQVEGKCFLEYFVLPLKWDAVAIGTVEDQTQQVPNDSDFLLRRINRACFEAGSYVENPHLLMSLIDSGSGRLFNSQQRVSVVGTTGTGQRNYDLPEPRIISGGNALTVSLENLTGVELDYFYLDLIGTKIFYNPGHNIDTVVKFRGR